MGRLTKVLAFSVPPAIARQIEETAKEECKTKSELLRSMWQAYLVTREKAEFSRIKRSAERAARQAGLIIRTEKDVDRILHQR
jgi:metal-responsive CopG/Arc/MetJ family transcriptional regulator